eukprot:5415495-Pleurochrysis_carterae.AAC.1
METRCPSVGCAAYEPGARDSRVLTSDVGGLTQLHDSDNKSANGAQAAMPPHVKIQAALQRSNVRLAKSFDLPRACSARCFSACDRLGRRPCRSRRARGRAATLAFLECVAPDTACSGAHRYIREYTEL